MIHCLYPNPGITVSPYGGYSMINLGSFDTLLAHITTQRQNSCAFLSVSTVSIPKNVQHQLNMDCVGQRYRLEYSGGTGCLEYCFSKCVLKNSGCWKEVSPRCHHGDRGGCLWQLSGPPLCFVQSNFTVTVGFHTVFVQRASRPQSLWKANDLSISCSQNAGCLKWPFLESD